MDLPRRLQATPRVDPDLAQLFQPLHRLGVVMEPLFKEVRASRVGVVDLVGEVFTVPLEERVTLHRPALHREAMVERLLVLRPTKEVVVEAELVQLVKTELALKAATAATEVRQQFQQYL